MWSIICSARLRLLVADRRQDVLGQLSTDHLDEPRAAGLADHDAASTLASTMDIAASSPRTFSRHSRWVNGIADTRYADVTRWFVPAATPAIPSRNDASAL